MRQLDCLWPCCRHPATVPTPRLARTLQLPPPSNALSFYAIVSSSSFCGPFLRIPVVSIVFMNLRPLETVQEQLGQLRTEAAKSFGPGAEDEESSMRGV